MGPPHCDSDFEDCHHPCHQPPPTHHCAELFVSDLKFCYYFPVAEGVAGLQIEQAVCKLCGRLSPCFHDYGLPIPSAVTTQNSDPITVSIPSILPHGRDICLPYGVGLTNSFFLARCGFIPMNNEHNVVTFGWPGSGIDLAQEGAFGVLWAQVYNSVKEEVGRLMVDDEDRGWIVASPRSRIDETPALMIHESGPSIGLFVWLLMKALTQASYPVQTQDLPHLIIQIFKEIARIDIFLAPDLDPGTSISYHVSSMVLLKAVGGC